MKTSTLKLTGLPVRKLAFRFWCLIALSCCDHALLGASEAGPGKVPPFQSTILNGQVKDRPIVLAEIARQYSKDRILLIIFGNASTPSVRSFKERSFELLTAMSKRGYRVALLHVETSLYREGPPLMLEEASRPFVDPSALIYVDGLQLTYVRDLSDKQIDFIERAMVILEQKFLKQKS